MKRARCYSGSSPRLLGGIFSVLICLAFLIGGHACLGADEDHGVSAAYSRSQDTLWKARGTVPKEPGRAAPDDELVIEVLNYDLWLENQDVTARKSALVLFLDHKELPGLHLRKYAPPTWVIDSRTAKTNKIDYFGVNLEQTDANRAVWKKLARSPDFKLERPTEVSIGFPGGDPMHTWVYPTADTGKEHGKPFHLAILSRSQVYLGLFVIVGAFFLFLRLACHTDLLRDPNLPLRADGSRPFSLARTQMAFWFFLVFGSFFFLWLVSGDTDTLNSSTIALIGISAGTAVSSAFIDSSKRRILDENVVLQKNADEGAEELIKALKADLRKNQELLIDNRAAWEVLELEDKVALEANETEKASLYERKRLLEHQIEFFESPSWKTVMYDLLAENGVISFHRFQMCVWTVVLGIIFISDVYSKAAMPDFSATLLGLMGVSAGTFVGFKLPTQAK